MRLTFQSLIPQNHEQSLVKQNKRLRYTKLVKLSHPTKIWFLKSLTLSLKRSNRQSQRPAVWIEERAAGDVKEAVEELFKAFNDGFLLFRTACTCVAE